MTTKDDGGPAFPAQKADARVKGMTLRAYAAIHLRQPDSGLPWLDDMIRQAQRDNFAGQALAGLLASADAMLAARQGGAE